MTELSITSEAWEGTKRFTETDAPAPPVTPPDPAPSYAFVHLYFQEGEKTPDRRLITPQATNFDRSPPYAIRLQTTQPESGGHAGAIVCGTIDKIARFGNTIIGTGRLDLSFESSPGVFPGRQAKQLIENRTMQTWSPDMGNATVVAEPDPDDPDQPLAVYKSASFLGATLVAMPALGSAFIELLDDSGNVTVSAPTRETIMASMEEELIHLTTDELAARNFPTATRKQYAKRGIAMKDGSYPIPDKDALRRAISSIGRGGAEKRSAIVSHIRKRARALKATDMLGPKTKVRTAALLAHAVAAAPPASFFTKPELTGLQRWTKVTDDGHVFGHLAGRDECHIGFSNRCVTIDEVLPGGFGYVNDTGHVVCSDGSEIGTSPIPVLGGHADEEMSASDAKDYYDNPATVVADVVFFEDDFGISFSGALRPSATAEMVYALRASGVSLDAREIDDQLRLLGGCCVNRPGFPKVTARIIASSSDETSGEDADDFRIVTLVAAGGRPLPDPDLIDELGMDLVAMPDNEEVEERLARVESIIAASDLEEKIWTELAAEIDTPYTQSDN